MDFSFIFEFTRGRCRRRCRCRAARFVSCARAINAIALNCNQIEGKVLERAQAGGENERNLPRYTLQPA